MATHEIHPAPGNHHGRFSHATPIALTVASGDRIVASTLDADWGLVETADPFGPPAKMQGVANMDGHALLGPIAVEGAEPGDALEIQLETIRPATRGWVCAGGWPSEFNVRLGLDKEEHFRQPMAHRRRGPPPTRRAEPLHQPLPRLDRPHARRPGPPLHHPAPPHRAATSTAASSSPEPASSSPSRSPAASSRSATATPSKATARSPAPPWSAPWPRRDDPDPPQRQGP